MALLPVDVGAPMQGPGHDERPGAGARGVREPAGHSRAHRASPALSRRRLLSVLTCAGRPLRGTFDHPRGWRPAVFGWSSGYVTVADASKSPPDPPTGRAQAHRLGLSAAGPGHRRTRAPAFGSVLRASGPGESSDTWATTLRTSGTPCSRRPGSVLHTPGLGAPDVRARCSRRPGSVLQTSGTRCARHPAIRGSPGLSGPPRPGLPAHSRTNRAAARRLHTSGRLPQESVAGRDPQAARIMPIPLALDPRWTSIPAGPRSRTS